MFLELGLLFCIFSWRETLNLQLLHGVCSVDTWRAACSWCPRQTLTGAERSMARHGMGSWQPTAPMLTCAAWCYKTITFRLRNYNIVLYGEDYCFQDHMECGAIWKTLAVLSLAVSCHKGSSLNHLSSLISCTNNHHQQLSVLWRHHCWPQRFPTSQTKKKEMLLLIAHGQLLIFEKSRGASKIWKPTIHTHTCTCQTQYTKVKSWMKNEDPPLQVLHFYNIFFLGGCRHSQENPLLRSMGNFTCLPWRSRHRSWKLPSRPILSHPNGWVERVEKGAKREAKKIMHHFPSCTIFHHEKYMVFAPFPFEEIHGKMHCAA